MDDRMKSVPLISSSRHPTTPKVKGRTPGSSRGRRKVTSPSWSVYGMLKALRSAIYTCFKCLFCCCIREVPPNDDNLLGKSKRDSDIAESTLNQFGRGTQKTQEHSPRGIDDEESIQDAPPYTPPDRDDKIQAQGEIKAEVHADEVRDKDAPPTSITQPAGTTHLNTTAHVNGPTLETLRDDNCSETDSNQFFMERALSMVECNEQHVQVLEELILSELAKMGPELKDNDWEKFLTAIKSHCTKIPGLKSDQKADSACSRQACSEASNDQDKMLNIHLITVIARTLSDFTKNESRVRGDYENWLKSKTEDSEQLSNKVKAQLERIVKDLGFKERYEESVAKAQRLIVDIKNGKDGTLTCSPKEIKGFENLFKKFINSQLSICINECAGRENQGMVKYEGKWLPSFFIDSSAHRLDLAFMDDDGKWVSSDDQQKSSESTGQDKLSFVVSEISRLASDNEEVMQHICRYATQDVPLAMVDALTQCLVVPTYGADCTFMEGDCPSISLRKECGTDRIIISYEFNRIPKLYQHQFGVNIVEIRGEERWLKTARLDCHFSVILDPNDLGKIEYGLFEGQVFFP